MTWRIGARWRASLPPRGDTDDDDDEDSDDDDDEDEDEDDEDDEEDIGKNIAVVVRRLV